MISSASEITVTFVDNSAVKGTIKGTDADNDLAIVAVALSDLSSDTLDQISVVSIGDSDDVKVGQSVVAIGNALGYGQSVSKGIVSALNREVTDSDGSVKTLIQTDASINPGNSGGALLNMKGELIGINEAKYVDTSVEGVGYAIPMNIAEPILEKLGSKQARTKVSDDQASYIGITCVTMPDSYVEQGYPQGVYVASVISGGPADQAGIKAGDIITSMDGTSVSTKEELINRIRTSLGGRAAEIAYYGEKDGVSTGASGDLEQATRVAAAMISVYGMDDDFGLAYMDPKEAMRDPAFRKKVNEILGREMRATIEIIQKNRARIDRMVAELLKKNKLTGDEIEELLKE